LKHSQQQQQRWQLQQQTSLYEMVYQRQQEQQREQEREQVECERDQHQRRDREKIFSPSMLDSIVVGVRQWCVRSKFLAVSVVFRTVDEVGIGISVELELKTSFDETYGATHVNARIGIREHEYERRWVDVDVSAASTSTPQLHIGDKDKLVDASALDTFNASDTLAREMSPTPSTSSDLDQGGDGDVGLAEMSMSLSLELAAFTLRAS